MNLEPCYNEADTIIGKYSIDTYCTILPVLPIPSPRMTQSDKWNKRDIVTRYYKYKDDVKFWSNKHDYTLSQPLSLIFCLSIPKSYKKNVLHDLVKVKPDLDNLIKAFKDSFGSNDSFIAEYGRMLKVYSDNPMIIIL